jgi:hypothetical protein
VTSPIVAPAPTDAQDDLPYAERLRRYSQVYDQVALRLQSRLRKAATRQDRMRARLELGAFIADVRRQLLPESAAEGPS